METKFLAIVPARGGSQGIKLKNLQKVHGKSLVALAAEICTSIPEITHSIVSTDHNQILIEAKEHGLEAPFLRPPELSGHLVSDIEVLYHAVQSCEEIYKLTYDFILMLQPTSPNRLRSDVLEIIQEIQARKCDAIWTLSETDSKEHPLKQLKLDINQRKILYYDERGKDIIARQMLSKLYHRNGIAYAFSRKAIMEDRTIYPENTSYIITKRHVANIDTPIDLKIANLLD